MGSFRAADSAHIVDLADRDPGDLPDDRQLQQLLASSDVDPAVIAIAIPEMAHISQVMPKTATNPSAPTKPNLDDRATWRAVYFPSGHEKDCLCVLCRIRRQHPELED